MTLPDIEDKESTSAVLKIPKRFIVYDARNPVRALGLGVFYPNGWTAIQWRVIPERDNPDISLTELDEYTQPYNFKSWEEFQAKVTHPLNWVD